MIRPPPEPPAGTTRGSRVDGSGTADASAGDFARGQARTTLLTLLIVGTTLGLAGLALFWFNPEQHAFFPQCILYRTTGLLCPGCGGLRATHQLLHGHLAEAFRLNALFVSVLPLLAAYTWDRWRVSRGRPGLRVFRQRWWLGVLLAAATAFTIGRNLPLAATWLRPAPGPVPAQPQPAPTAPVRR